MVKMAEMGLAVVNLNFNRQEARGETKSRLTSLCNWLSKQPWADADRVFWYGETEAAELLLKLYLQNLEHPPKLLVLSSCGGVGELEADQNVEYLLKNNKTRRSVALIHDEADERFPLSDAKRFVARLRTIGVHASMIVLPKQNHVGGDRLVVRRLVSELCIESIIGTQGWNSYNYFASAHKDSIPSYAFYLPAILCIFVRVSSSWQRIRTLASTTLRSFNQRASFYASLILLFLSTLQCVFYAVIPSLSINARSLAMTRRYFVKDNEKRDFDHLSADLGWQGKRIETLLEQVKLANYTRSIVAWELPEDVYWQFVLSPRISQHAQENWQWRRLLWEQFYPFIRKEKSTTDAALIVVSQLRGMVSIKQVSFPLAISQSLRKEVTNESGFESLYVATLRSVAIPARLGEHGHAEFWTGSSWQAAPRPLLEYYDYLMGES